MRTTGIWVGLALTVGLCALVLHDRQARLDAASRQSMALAAGVDRLLHYELRNVHRAMRGIVAAEAADAGLPASESSARRDARVRSIVRRYEELDNILRFDAGGVAAAGGDPRISAWLRTLASTDVPFAAGPLLRVPAGWLLPLAVPREDGGWMVAIFRTGALESMVDGLDTGREGNATIYTQGGTVVARFGHLGTHVGRQVELPAGVRRQGARYSSHLVSRLDGIERAVTFSNTSDYPFVVSAGIGVREALAP